jgi:hypothetical protein
MIQAKVTKNIMAKSAMDFNGLPITWGQIISTIITIGVGIAEFLLLDMGQNGKMAIIFLTLISGIMFSVVKINGLSFYKFLAIGLKGVDKRPYSSKGFKGDEF